MDDNLPVMQNTSTTERLFMQNTSTTERLLELAVSKGADIEKLEKLMELHERHEHLEAKKAYVLAVTAFKSDSPTVIKDLVNKQYNSTYASLGNMVNTINPILSKHGLSVAWDVTPPTNKQDGEVSVSCIMTHCLGHSEKTSFSAPPDKSGSKNTIQQYKSTVTYLRALTFEAITGIATSDANIDDDGNGFIETINIDQQTEITDLINESSDPKETKTAALKYAGANSIETIPQSKYKGVVTGLKHRASK